MKPRFSLSTKVGYYEIVIIQNMLAWKYPIWLNDNMHVECEYEQRALLHPRASPTVKRWLTEDLHRTPQFSRGLRQAANDNHNYEDDSDTVISGGWHQKIPGYRGGYVQWIKPYQLLTNWTKCDHISLNCLSVQWILQVGESLIDCFPVLHRYCKHRARSFFSSRFTVSRESWLETN